jgi:cytochrome c oxidase subunit IV
MAKPPASVLGPWVALLALLMATLGLAYLPLGAGNLVVSLTIATAKGAIVAAVFMKLVGRPTLRWVFAGAGLFWLSFLFGLSMTDYATRTGWPFAG